MLNHNILFTIYEHDLHFREEFLRLNNGRILIAVLNFGENCYAMAAPHKKDGTIELSQKKWIRAILPI